MINSVSNALCYKKKLVMIIFTLYIFSNVYCYYYITHTQTNKNEAISTTTL